MGDHFDNWTIQARKGLLEYLILSALLDGDRYGYDLVKLLVARSGMSMTEGTVYPLLARMKKQGMVDTQLVESSEGPVRKYYTLTSGGHEARRAMRAYLEIIMVSADRLAGEVAGPGAPEREGTKGDNNG
ncbi:MAG: PadR family transcriptional regulator [Chromatiales bacterium]|jgi:PadR family transcriptional regulator, regulatory protein PadR|nr:PadR family transcriptional regulator [Chromatiales bacterium]